MNTKKTYFKNINAKIKTQTYHKPSKPPQRLNKPRKQRCVFQRCQNVKEASGNYQFVITLLRQKHSSANSLV